MAERIRRLPDDLVASFALANSVDRVRRLQHIATEITIGMFPVISWLERKRPADKAEIVKRRMHFVLQEVVQCAMLEIPEYAGGTIIMQTGGRPPSDGARRTAEMVVFVRAFSATLREWADDIQAEEQQPPHLPPGARPGKGPNAAATAPAVRRKRHRGRGRRTPIRWQTGESAKPGPRGVTARMKSWDAISGNQSGK
jgi:hypothetical protein